LFDVSFPCRRSPAGNIVNVGFLINCNLVGDSGLAFPNAKEMWMMDDAGQHQKLLLKICTCWTSCSSACTMVGYQKLSTHPVG